MNKGIGQTSMFIICPQNDTSLTTFCRVHSPSTGHQFRVIAEKFYFYYAEQELKIEE